MSASPLKVSIIVDNFNYDKYLKIALDSALSQTYPDCEVIVVDDGSTDRSREILSEYSDRALVIFQENGGQASAFNTGFERSNGDLVIFLDSDDSLDADAVEKAVASWKPHYTKLQYALRIIGSDDKPSGLRMPSAALSEGKVSAELLSTGYYITSPTSGNMYSRTFLSKLMPMPVRGWAEGNDSYLNTYAGFWGEVGAIQEELGCYRIHESNMSSVAHNRIVNLKQVDKLIEHGLRQQALVEQIAREMSIDVNPHTLESHWLHLKLVIAKEKLRPVKGFGPPKALRQAVVQFSMSVFKTPQLTASRKLKLIAWSVLTAFSPKAYAERFVAYAFEKKPSSQVLRFLRRP